MLDASNDEAKEADGLGKDVQAAGDGRAVVVVAGDLATFPRRDKE